MKAFYSCRSSVVRGVSIVLIVMAGLLCRTAYAAQPDARPASSIEVSAEAEVEVAADVALIDVGVVTRAPTAAAAARENGERMQAVLARIRNAFGPKAQLSTGMYALNPVYSAPRDGTEPKVTGYSASNVIHVKTSELTRIGDLVDISIQAGANQVQRIAFTLSDQTGPRDTALRDAVLKARHEAEIIAAALGVKITGFHSAVVQDSGVVRPLMREAMMARVDGAAATPVEPGSVPVRARVVLTVEIAR
ncbi:MAG TPA: SIMPL domain-containing protein [Burkholderiales bacterium]|nr:SIMPL domain-containing protein [Burkholderiales bacterium]